MSSIICAHPDSLGPLFALLAVVVCGEVARLARKTLLPPVSGLCELTAKPFLNAPSPGALMFLPTLCPRSTHLTGVQLESVSAAAGRNPLAVLAVDLGALEAGDAAARLLRHGVLGPLHEALHCWFTLTISYIHPTST